MDNTQMELDFGGEITSEDAIVSGASNVVLLSQFASARQVALQSAARSRLVQSIVESVDDVWDDLEVCSCCISGDPCESPSDGSKPSSSNSVSMAVLWLTKSASTRVNARLTRKLWRATSPCRARSPPTRYGLRPSGTR